ncbi:hypothetical protein MBANPS3_011830 [Mucor bainieri]
MFSSFQLTTATATATATTTATTTAVFCVSAGPSGSPHSFDPVNGLPHTPGRRYTTQDISMLIGRYKVYYVETNTRANVSSPNRVQINKTLWDQLTDDYNQRTFRTVAVGQEQSYRCLWWSSPISI